jgi:uncharacterized protein
MRRLFIAVGLICLALPVPARSSTPYWLMHQLGAIDCKGSLGADEKYVCDHAELLAQDREMARVYEHLRKHFTGDDRRIFMTGQWSWGNSRLGCFDVRERARYHEDYMSCVRDMYRERLATLKALEADSSLLRTRAADYDYIDPWYLNQFAEQYDGKKINLDGFIGHLDCGGPLSPVRARIGQDGSWVAAEFESLTYLQLNFLCEKGIGTLWDGVVRLEAQGHPVLHLTKY